MMESLFSQRNQRAVVALESSFLCFVSGLPINLSSKCLCSSSFFVSMDCIFSFDVGFQSVHLIFPSTL